MPSRVLKSLPLLAVVACFSTGCAYFGGAKTPSQTLIDCYADALKPAVGDVFDSAELARDLVAGRASLSSIAANLLLQPAVVESTRKALVACGAPTAPEPEAPAEPTAS